MCQTLFLMLMIDILISYDILYFIDEETGLAEKLLGKETGSIVQIHYNYWKIG